MMESVARMKALRMAASTSLGHLHPDMTAVVPNSYSHLEHGLLANLSLLLQQHALQNLVLEGHS